MLIDNLSLLSEPLKLSRKGRCGIAQASNIGCKSVSITPEDKHALLDFCLGICSHVYFPRKAGTITKTMFVSFNKVMCSLELTVEHCLACVPFWGTILSTVNEKPKIIYKDSTAIKDHHVWVHLPDVAKESCITFYAIYIF